MSPEHWERVEEAFLRCVDLPASGRAAAIDQACGGDATLRREVESLLRAHARAEAFEPAGDAVRPVLEALETEYYLGRQLGRYRIESFVARGSTGSVYRAIDTLSNAHEAVAIKILAPELLSAGGALDRLRERIRAISAIRHDNVAAVHSLEVVDGVAFVVMEFVEGRTIRPRTKGPSAIQVAWRLARALRAVHRAGVAHGDVRPSNVMVDSAGRVKLVDFNHAEGEFAADWAGYRRLLSSLFAPNRAVAIAAAAIAVAAGGIAVSRTGPAPSPAAWSQLTYDAGLTLDAAASSDGKWLAYASDRGESGRGRNSGLDVWVQPYPSGPARPITNHEADDRSPSFSPDGRWIAFRSERDGGGVYRCPAGGGPEQLLAPRGFRPRYSPDGKWIAYFVGAESERVPNRVFVIPAEGGASVPVASSLETAATPVWSPDSSKLLVVGRGPGESHAALWLAPAGGGAPTRVELMDFRLEGREILPYRLLPEDWPGDRVLLTHFHGSTTAILEARLSGHRLLGPPRVVASGAGTTTWPVKMRDGRVVYSVLDRSFGVWMLPVTSSFDSPGPLSTLEVVKGMAIHPSIGPGGNVLLWSHWGPENSAVMRRDLTSENEPAVVARLPGRSWAKFLPDGRVAYLTDSEGSAAVFAGSVDTGPGEKIASVRAYLWDVSPDGRQILEPSGTRPARVLVTGRGETRVLLEDPSRDVTLAHFSPDSAWVAFVAGERIYIAPFPAGKPWIEASATLGSVAEWAPNGAALYFVSEADGFACLWVQRLDPVRKHPVGAAVPVRHFHRYTLTPRDLPRRHQRFAAADDKVVMVLRRMSGNLFVAR